MTITYPRECRDCRRVYKSPSTFSGHKPKCPEYAARLAVDEKMKEAAMILISEKKLATTINNNSQIVNDHSVKNTDNSVNNTSVVINVQNNISGIHNSLATSLKTSSLSSQEIKCVEKVLLMLRKEGITTLDALHVLIEEKSVTIQQLEQDIKECSDRDCDTVIEFGASEVAKVKKAKENKIEKDRLTDIHLRYSVVNLFQNLVLKKEGDIDLHVTSNSLATNPLYLSREGLSVWSQNTGIKRDSTKFGKPDKGQLCSWLLVQEDRFWRTLIMDIFIPRLEKFLYEEHTGPLREVKKRPEMEDPMDYFILRNAAPTEEDDEYCIAGHRYEGKYSNLMNRIRGFKNEGIGKEAFVTPVIADLKKCLGETCKQAPNKGWFHLTSHLSEQKDAQNFINDVEKLRISE